MPITKPLITIIIPHFRRIDFTLQALRSIKSQRGISFRLIKVIVCDEEYSLKTRQSLSKTYSGVTYLKNHHQEGPGGNRQTGLEQAHSQYVLFLDSDDQLKPTYLSEMTKTLHANPQAVGVVCQSVPKYEVGFNIRHRLKLLPLTLIRDISLWLTALNGWQLFPSAFYLCQLSHMIFRRSALLDFKFNYDYRRGGEDWDLITKSMLRGSIVVNPKKLLIFRYSPGSSTENPINQKLKWDSYMLLLKRLKPKFKTGIFYKLFLRYINLFKAK